MKKKGGRGGKKKSKNCLTNVGQEADELRPRGEAIGKNLVDVRKDSLAVKNGRARLAVLLLRQVVEPL